MSTPAAKAARPAQTATLRVVTLLGLLLQVPTLACTHGSSDGASDPEVVLSDASADAAAQPADPAAALDAIPSVSSDDGGGPDGLSISVEGGEVATPAPVIRHRSEEDDASEKTQDETKGDGKSPMALGALKNPELEKQIWTAMDKRVTRTQKLDKGAEELAELGDFESFRFTVIKVMNGSDDISGDATQAADGLEIEVSGWYKKTLKEGEAEPKSTCFSFDAIAPLAMRGGVWLVPEDYQVTFGREDLEDCY